MMGDLNFEDSITRYIYGEPTLAETIRLEGWAHPLAIPQYIDIVTAEWNASEE
jgi:hypothetical protein